MRSKNVQLKDAFVGCKFVISVINYERHKMRVQHCSSSPLTTLFFTKTVRRRTQLTYF